MGTPAKLLLILTSGVPATVGGALAASPGISGAARAGTAVVVQAAALQAAPALAGGVTAAVRVGGQLQAAPAISGAAQGVVPATVGAAPLEASPALSGTAKAAVYVGAGSFAASPSMSARGTAAARVGGALTASPELSGAGAAASLVPTMEPLILVLGSAARVQRAELELVAGDAAVLPVALQLPTGALVDLTHYSATLRVQVGSNVATASGVLRAPDPQYRDIAIGEDLFLVPGTYAGAIVFDGPTNTDKHTLLLSSVRILKPV